MWSSCLQAACFLFFFKTIYLLNTEDKKASSIILFLFIYYLFKRNVLFVSAKLCDTSIKQTVLMKCKQRGFSEDGKLFLVAFLRQLWSPGFQILEFMLFLLKNTTVFPNSSHFLLQLFLLIHCSIYWKLCWKLQSKTKKQRKTNKNIQELKDRLKKMTVGKMERDGSSSPFML